MIPYFISIIVFWTACIAGLASCNIHHEKEHLSEIAYSEAGASFNKDLVYRRWASGHGGVYVPITEETPPNASLSFVTDRDITTPSGVRLTLMNPAYMMRQVHSLGERDYGFKGHITSLKPIRNQNAADPWEIEALKAFEHGIKEVSSVEMIAGKAYTRLMRPLFVDAGCLKCHVNQGYKVGEIRGGISVSVPMDKFDLMYRKEIENIIIGYGMIWILGLIGTAVGGYSVQHQFCQRKRTENMLRDSEYMYRSLFDNASDAILIHDLRGRFLNVNKIACERLGYTSEELLQMMPEDIDSPEYADKVPARMEEILREGHLVFETAHIRKDGSSIPIEMSSSVIIYQGQKAFLCYARDISKRKAAERAFRDSEERYKRLSNLAFEGILFHKNGIIIDCNQSFANLIGYNREELPGQNAVNLLVPEKYQTIVRQNMVKKNVSPYEIELAKKNGMLVNVELQARDIVSEGREMKVVAVRDITERKKTENKLRKIYRILNETQAISKVGGWEYDAVVGKLEWTDEVYRIYGVSRDYDPNVKGAVSFYDPESERIIEQAFKSALEAGEPYDLDLGFIRTNGEHIWVRTIGTPIIENGKVVRIIGNFMDITERKQMEKDLNNAIRYNRSLIEASIDPLVTISPDGKISDVNAATEQITGYSRTELIGQDFSNYFTEPEKARIGYRQVFEKGVVRDYFLEIRHRDGHVTPVLYNASVYRDEHENVTGVFAAARDITERIRAEEQIRASLSEKEVLLREIHHRVKNNLQVITSLLRLQSKQIKDRQILELFRESHTRISAMALIHETLYQSPELAHINFRRYSDKLMKSLFQIYGAKIGQIRLLIDVRDISLDIDRAIPLGLVINELASNALKYAFPEKKQGEIRLALCRKNSDMIELCVSDNGIGISPESDIRNMDSLGLRLVFDLVERQLQGSVEVIRTEGTRFVITFQEHG